MLPSQKHPWINYTVILTLGFILFVLLEFLWFQGTMSCIVNRSTQSGTVITWAVVKDCSY